MSSCKKINIECYFSNIKNLAQLEESHFPFDGHLTISGNHSVANDLSEWIKNW